MKEEFGIPEVVALGEERLRLIQEAAEKSRGKEGMDKLDVFLEYGEKLAEGGALPEAEQRALLEALGVNLPKNSPLWALMKNGGWKY